MKLNEALSKYNISDATLRNWKKLNYIKDINDIKEEEIEAVLKNKTGIRRNKRNSIESIIPISYVEDNKIITIIEKIIELKNKYDLSTNEVLYETIIKLLNNNKLEIPTELDDILGKRNNNVEFLHEFDNITLSYDDDNDFLGCLYMSLLSIGKKDVNGIYYTPYKVVNKIVSSIDFDENKRVVDPGCGSGNFLIQAFKKMRKSKIPTTTIINNLYGFDIDKIAVLLSKINIYLLDSNINYNDINIYLEDFLNKDDDIKFDIVIGNPPWGKKYNADEKKELKKKFNLAFSKMDSFAQFIIKSFNSMNDNAVLGFVLPSSFLNIATHENIRKFILENKIDYIKNIGREFEEIVTDVIIIKIEKTYVENNKCEYDEQIINQEDFKNNPYCNFLIADDKSTAIIEKIKKVKSIHLTENVEYALGIVTGDNKKYISDSKNNDNEYIISGKDLNRYNVDYNVIKKYISFKPEQFQQVAKESLYRNKNKIIYKFIGKKLCFAAEQNGTLTLNSANIICLPEDYDLYYITAILNSRITQLYFEDTYNTQKKIKNHIQSFSIPIFDNNIMKKISDICKNIKGTDNYCEEIESIIYEELNLTKDEIMYLKNRFE